MEHIQGFMFLVLSFLYIYYFLLSSFSLFDPCFLQLLHWEKFLWKIPFKIIQQYTGVTCLVKPFSTPGKYSIMASHRIVCTHASLQQHKTGSTEVSLPQS